MANPAQYLRLKVGNETISMKDNWVKNRFKLVMMEWSGPSIRKHTMHFKEFISFM